MQETSQLQATAVTKQHTHYTSIICDFWKHSFWCTVLKIDSAYIIWKQLRAVPTI